MRPARRWPRSGWPRSAELLPGHRHACPNCSPGWPCWTGCGPATCRASTPTGSGPRSTRRTRSWPRRGARRSTGSPAPTGPADARALVALARRADELGGGLRLADALARLAAGGTPLMRGAAGRGTGAARARDPGEFGARLASWVDGADDAGLRARLTGTCAALLAVAGPAAGDGRARWTRCWTGSRRCPTGRSWPGCPRCAAASTRSAPAAATACWRWSRTARARRRARSPDPVTPTRRRWPLLALGGPGGPARRWQQLGLPRATRCGRTARP